MAEFSSKQGYHIIQEWHQAAPISLWGLANEWGELYYGEALKPGREIELFINNSSPLKENLERMQDCLRRQFKMPFLEKITVASIEESDALTIISSLLAEQKISFSHAIQGLDKELRYFDASREGNHRAYALFNCAAQFEHNRLTKRTKHYSVSGNFSFRPSYSFLSW